MLLFLVTGKHTPRIQVEAVVAAPTPLEAQAIVDLTTKFGLYPDYLVEEIGVPLRTQPHIITIHLRYD